MAAPRSVLAVHAGLSGVFHKNNLPPKKIFPAEVCTTIGVCLLATLQRDTREGMCFLVLPGAYHGSTGFNRALQLKLLEPVHPLS